MDDGIVELLLVEDNPRDARLYESFLQGSRGDFRITHCVRLSEATEALSKGRTGAVLLDLGLPDASGLTALREAHRTAPGIPIVVLTGMSDEQTALEALKEGAQDYLVKGQIDSHSLTQSLRYSIERQRLQTETEKMRRRQIEMKDEFLSHVSHELRSPLNAIYQFVSILADGLGGECTAQQKEYLEIISRNVVQLQSMIGELLDVTRAGAGKFSLDLEASSLVGCAEDAIHTVSGAAAEKGVSFSVEIAPDLPPAYADPDRLRQVLVNLLENAIRFTPTEGKVSVRGWMDAGNPEMLQCSVADTGCGIPQEEWTRIFDRLHQVSEKDHGRTGLGLGLYICRELVTKQGGRIWVEDSSDTGSVFRFTLPIFRLAKALAPIVSAEPRFPNSLALIGIQLWMRGGWPSDSAREMAVREARYLLGRCVVAEPDVVLPMLWPSGDSEYLFLAARTDAQGAAAVEKRIQESLERDEVFRREGTAWRVQTRMVPIEPGADKAGSDAFANQSAAAILKEIEEWTRSSGKEHHG